MSTVLRNHNFTLYKVIHPVGTRRKLNVHKTFRRRPRRLLNVLCTFNLRPRPTGHVQGIKFLNVLSRFPSSRKITRTMYSSMLEQISLQCHALMKITVAGNQQKFDSRSNSALYILNFWL